MSVLDLASAAAAPPSAALSAAAPSNAAPPPLAASAAVFVIAVDLLPLPAIPHVHAICGDFTSPATQAAVAACLRGGRADVLLSDMAHSFTGAASLDHARQMRLAWEALAFSRARLRRRGRLVIKVRYGGEYKNFVDTVRALFVRVEQVKPPASRAESAEAYVVGIDFRGAAAAAWSAEARAAMESHGVACGELA